MGKSDDQLNSNGYHDEEDNEQTSSDDLGQDSDEENSPASDSTNNDRRTARCANSYGYFRSINDDLMLLFIIFVTGFMMMQTLVHFGNIPEPTIDMRNDVIISHQRHPVMFNENETVNNDIAADPLEEDGNYSRNGEYRLSVEAMDNQAYVSDPNISAAILDDTNEEIRFSLTVHPYEGDAAAGALLTDENIEVEETDFVHERLEDINSNQVLNPVLIVETNNDATGHAEQIEVIPSMDAHANERSNEGESSLQVRDTRGRILVLLNPNRYQISTELNHETMQIDASQTPSRSDSEDNPTHIHHEGQVIPTNVENSPPTSSSDALAMTEQKNEEIEHSAHRSTSSSSPKQSDSQAQSNEHQLQQTLE